MVRLFTYLASQREQAENFLLPESSAKTGAQALFGAHLIYDVKPT